MHRHQASRTPWAGRILASVSVLAGAVVANAGSPAAADPGANGLIAFTSFRDQRMEVYAIQPDGTGERNLTRFPDAADSHPAWSPDGTRIAFSSNRTGSGDIYVMEPDGSGQTRLTTSPSNDFYPAWSPEGARIAFTNSGSPNNSIEVFVMDADGSDEVAISNHPTFDAGPAWSPNGELIAFGSERENGLDVWVMAPDGSNPVNLTKAPGSDETPAWSPDGSRIAFGSRRDGNDEIYLMNADGSGQTRLTTNPAFDGQPTWSPDGTKIAFASTRLGNTDIYVMNPDGSGVTRVTTNAAADIDPDWQWIDPDQTPPSIVGTVTPPPNGAGWNNQLPVTVTFTCSDEDSGIASCTSPVTIPDQTPGQDESGTAVDNAGNTASTSVTVRADVTPPTVTINDPPALAGLPVPPACQITGTATDALSGIGDVTVTFTNLLAMATESRSATSLTGSTWAVTTEDLLPGLYSATARSGDVAGNQSAPSREVRFLTLVCLPGPR